MRSWRVGSDQPPNRELDQGGGITTVAYRNRGKGSFIGRIHDNTTEKYLCAIRFKESSQYYGLGLVDWDQFMWIHMLQRMQVMFETGSMPDTRDEIVEKTAMFVAAFRSILRESGDFVAIDGVDEDWAIGTPWGHGDNPPMDEQNVYQQLFGLEKGELRADLTLPLSLTTS